MAVTGTIDRFSYWYSGMTSWEYLDPLNPPQVPSDTELLLCVWWLNTGTETFRGRAHLVLIFPDSTRVTAVAELYQDEEAAPGSGYGVSFGGMTLTEPGTYQAEATLESVLLQCCPYCTECFDTYEELVTHVQTAHPGERIPIEIIWD